MASIQTLVEEFEVLGFDSPAPKVLVKCLEICAVHDITSESFVEQWVAFSLCNPNLLGGTQEPTLDSIGSFERKIYSNLDKNSASQKKESKKLYTRQSIPQSTVDPILNVYNEGASIPKINQTTKRKLNSIERSQEYSVSSCLSPQSLNPSQCKLSETYKDRKDSAQILMTFGRKELVDKATFKNVGNCEKISIKQWGNEENWLPSNVMLNYEVLLAKATSLSYNAEWIANYIIRKNVLETPENFIPNGSGIGTTYGRICCDGNSRLNPSSVLLESTQKFGNGRTAVLNLSNVPQGSLFPGQVVALRATTVNGDTLVVRNIYADATLELPEELPRIPTSGPLQIIIASGPFTLCNNLAYQPLLDLVTYINEHKPHVVIMLGPIVDSSHDGISDGSLAETFQSHFESLVEGFMLPLVEKESNTQVIMVSSYKDAHHHNVYPTPPYVLKGHHRNLHFMADPCVIDINGLVIGATSTDILFHMGKEELFWSKLNSDRMARFAKYILSQQCFYPLYPPFADMCVDHGLLEKHGILDVTPHIMILPSNFRYFVKNIDGCVVVNPERLSKGFVGGTFARMEVHPNQPDRTIAEHVICQILKI